MLKQQLQQKLQQKLSPAQIQVIKMLEIPTIELEERIRQELEENPALEEGYEATNDTINEKENDQEEEYENSDDFDLEDYFNEDDDTPDYKLKTNNHSKDDKYEQIPFSVASTFHEHLKEQIGLLSINDNEKQLAYYIIGNIDDEGYLRRDAESMVDDIVFQAGIETNDEEMLKLINLIQQLDPPGVAAKDLQECLLLQLYRKPKTNHIIIAQKILEKYFDEFSKKHYEKILRGLDIDEDTLKETLDEIIKLNPKPGNTWGGNAIENTLSTIIPDFILENEDGVLSVQLNNTNVPDLRINTTYNNMLEDYSNNKNNQTKELKDTIIFVKQKIDAARWFIDAIKQRQQTLLSTMTAIVNFQREFFLNGDEIHLKPMVLKDIADITGYDISTISRVSNSKYIQTNFGVFLIKYFFSESLTTQSGEEVSTREIKKIMQECIDAEDKRKPMNDDKLVEKLNKKGYKIARRTVAKYREQLNIPVARLRKEI